MNPIELLDYAGVAVFAATGALAASRKELDIIGFLFLASITGIGGGTLRDVILNLPVFWVANSGYVLICAVMAVLVFFSAHRVESRYKLLLWLDAIGLAAFAVMGAAKGLAITGSPVVSVITGVLTATFGHIARPDRRRAFRAAQARNLCHRGACGCSALHGWRSRWHVGPAVQPARFCGGLPGAGRGAQIRLVVPGL